MNFQRGEKGQNKLLNKPIRRRKKRLVGQQAIA